jgi:hypothetical protein
MSLVYREIYNKQLVSKVSDGLQAAYVGDRLWGVSSVSRYNDYQMDIQVLSYK